MLSAVLEVALGLSFLFFVLSLICSALNEAIAGVFALRARTLDQGVQHLLDSPGEADRFYRHPLIQSLYRPRRKPSYIASDRFALAVVDLYLPQVLRGETEPAFAPGTTPRVQQVFELLWLEAAGNVDAFRKNVEKWFDETMERVSGWYRRRAQLILLALAVVATVVLNVNAVGITQRLWTDAPLRAAVAGAGVTAATSPTGSTPAPDPLQRLNDEYRRLDASKLPLGWAKENRRSAGWVALSGWAITVLAISLGAPFWFDVLSRAAQLRASGAKPEDPK